MPASVIRPCPRSCVGTVAPLYPNKFPTSPCSIRPAVGNCKLYFRQRLRLSQVEPESQAICSARPPTKGQERRSRYGRMDAIVCCGSPGHRAED